MPADLFRPALPAGPRRALIPLSIAAHAVALSALVIAPIMADADLPEPAHAAPIYVEVTVPSLPPAPPRREAARQPTRATVSNPAAAPIVAPDRIVPEGPPVAFDGVEIGIPAGDGIGPVGAIPGGMVTGYEPPTAPPRRPLKVGSGIQAPRKLRDVPPKYPQLAVQARVEGTVVIEAVIGTDGRVTSTHVLHSVTLLDRAAIDAVSQWVFSPTLLNGEPVPVVMNVTVEFRLR